MMVIGNEAHTKKNSLLRFLERSGEANASLLGCYLTFQCYYTVFTVDNTRREGISVMPWKKRISVILNKKDV